MFLPIECPQYSMDTEEKPIQNPKDVTQELRSSALFVSGRDFEKGKKAVVANLFSLWGIPLNKDFECVAHNEQYHVVVTGPSNFSVPADAPLYIKASRIISAARRISEKTTVIAHVTPRRGVREKIKEYMLQAKNPFQYTSLCTLLRNNQPFPDSVRVRAGEELAKYECKRYQPSADPIQGSNSLHALLSTVNTIVADAAKPSSFSEGEESIRVADNDIIRFLCVDKCFVRAIRENGASAFTPIRLRQSKDLFYKVESTYPGFKTDLSFLAR